MPFKKTDPKGIDQSIDANRIFVGRASELLFFRQDILEPENPKHNIISIFGQGGVGKSTLVKRLIEETYASDFKDYSLTALVNERQTNTISVMERFADQFNEAGHPFKKFQEANIRYKKALWRIRNEHADEKDVLLYETTDIVGTVIEELPFAGGLLHKGLSTGTDIVIDKVQKRQFIKDALQLEDPIDELTRAFVKDLNLLADTQVALKVRERRRQRRVILFFDTFEQSAEEIVPWLLDYFLEIDVSSNVVLVVAGRDSIENCTPDDPKRWLPYLDNSAIHLLPLDNLTELQTSEYLAERGINDSIDISKIWQLSRGLPLYLSLLTINPSRKVDPTADVVANFLRWIPAHDDIKRRLVLDAALFSKPFNQDDLTAFEYLKDDRPSLYRWLISQPFVLTNPEDGLHVYHDLTQNLLARYLFQRSRQEYFETRRALAQYYQQQIAKIQIINGAKMYSRNELLELVLALIEQLFQLPDEDGYIRAIEQLLNVNKYMDEEQRREINKVLYHLTQEHAHNQANNQAKEIAVHLLNYIDADQNSMKFIKSASYLLEKMARETSFPSESLALIHHDLGKSYESRKEFQLAISHFDNALKLDPESASAYNLRGAVYYALRQYRRAIEDYNVALELDPQNFSAYNNRGRAYYKLNLYQNALEDYNHALELDPKYYWTYFRRAYLFLRLQDIKQAQADFIQCWHLNSMDANAGRMIKFVDTSQMTPDLATAERLNTGWMIEFVNMCQTRPDSAMAERLDQIAQADPHYEAVYTYICRGVAHWLRGNLDQALAELVQAIKVQPESEDAYFWKGMICAYLGLDKEAISSIQKSLELELPRVLLAPLQWLKKDKPRFYKRYVTSFLAQ